MYTAIWNLSHRREGYSEKRKSCFHSVEEKAKGVKGAKVLTGGSQGHRNQRGFKVVLPKPEKGEKEHEEIQRESK